MTATIMPPDILKHLTPEFIAPVVGVLTAPNVSMACVDKAFTRELKADKIAVRYCYRDPT